LDFQVEQEVWRSALIVTGKQGFRLLLEQALGAYRRSPGYSPATRLHANLVGGEALNVLSLNEHGCQRPQVAAVEPGYVEIRLALRVHLSRYLLRFLVESSSASDPLMEAHLALEVGV
jgi:hypothetical protein